MKLASVAIALATVVGNANADMVDLGTWRQEGHASNGTWSLSSDRHSVFQSINGHPTAFVSTQNYDYRVFRGRIRIETGSDDDYVGFIVSYSPNDFIIFDWKKGDQGTAKKGFSLIHSRGTLDDLKSIGWDIHEKNTSKSTLLARDRSRGWTHNRYYDFQVQLKPNRLIASVDGQVIFDVETPAVKPGRFGFLNWSQSHVRYHSIQELHPPIPKDFSLDIDQGKSTRIIGEWTDGNTDESHTCRLANQPENGIVTFVPPCTFDYQPLPDSNGLQTFKYVVEDSSGISAEGVVNLNVLASGLNVDLPSHLVAGNHYSVKVEVSGTFSDAHPRPTISVDGPSWISFDEKNSRIHLAPTANHLGVQENIVISAVNSNGYKVELGKFDIQVIPSDKDDYLKQKFTLIPSTSPLKDKEDHFIVSVKLPALASGEDNLVEGPHEMIIRTDNSPETVVKYQGTTLTPGSSTSVTVNINPNGTVIPFEVYAPEADKAGFTLDFPWIDSPDDLRYVKSVSCGESDSIKCREVLESDRIVAPPGQIQTIFRDFDTKQYYSESFDASAFVNSQFMSLVRTMSEKDMFSVNINTQNASTFVSSLRLAVGDKELSTALDAYSGSDNGHVVFVKSKGVIDSHFDEKYRWGTSSQTWIGLEQ
ncbi:TSP C-terminal domain-containing protein [Vibrio jasicida]|jgi:hypothetical protein|uniref:TSP C-terminal domain-containing protein n=1 Tax=Vibrio jasicida TaxID=766224 RepID=A0AAU9QT06_9VIBR|nr:TSP C-terminal domain-containing protein [Vibrio jasicida]CAH1601414.1 TSP C-terminal domain-containing protein [Vibrio jasicida]